MANKIVKDQELKTILDANKNYIDNKAKNDWNATSTQDGYIANKPAILGGFILTNSATTEPSSEILVSELTNNKFEILAGSGIIVTKYGNNTVFISSPLKGLDSLQVKGGLTLVDSSDGNKWLSIDLDTALFKVISGTSLPSKPADGDENKIHLLSLSSTETNNAYAEYIWVNNKWEKFGEKSLSLDGYATNTNVGTTMVTNVTLGTRTATTAPLTIAKRNPSTGGTVTSTSASIPEATESLAGLLNATDKKKLNYVPDNTKSEISNINDKLDELDPVYMDVLIGLGKDYSIEVLNDDLEDSIENIYENLNRILYNPSLLTFKFVVIQSTLEEDENGDSLFGNVMDPIAAVTETVTISGDTAKFYTSIGNKNLIITLTPESIKAEFDKKSIGHEEITWEEGTGSNSVQMTGSNATGPYSVAEGQNTNSLGLGSHSEGMFTFALGPGSHSEGLGTEAQGEVSHTEGESTIASGNWSHAEGYNSEAQGECSHTEGKQTRTINKYEHASGIFNLSLNKSEIITWGDEDVAKYPGTDIENVGDGEDEDALDPENAAFGTEYNTLFSIGNGFINDDYGISTQADGLVDEAPENESVRHNAFEVRQSGDIYIADTNAAGEYYEKPMIHLQKALSKVGNNESSIITIYGNVYSTSTGTTYSDISSTSLRYLYLSKSEAEKLYNYIYEGATDKTLKLKFNVSSSKAPEAILNIEGTSNNQISFIYNGYRIIGSSLSSTRPTSDIRLTLTVTIFGVNLSGAASSTPARLVAYQSAATNGANFVYSSNEYTSGAPYIKANGELGAKNYAFNVSKVTSLSSLTFESKLIVATISTNQSLTIGTAPTMPKEIHIIVNNTSTDDRTITFPSTSTWHKTEDSITIPGSSFAEINIIYDGSDYWLRAI